MSIRSKFTYLTALAIRGETALFRSLRELKDLEGGSATQIDSYRDARLRSLLQHASRNVPYYRSLRLPVPEEYACPVDLLAAWPIVEKRELVEETTRRSEVRSGRIHVKSTGGSTGTPVRIIKDAEGIARERAASWLGLGWYGVGMGDRVARLWGTPVTPEARRRARFADRAMDRRTISVFDIDDASLERIWQELVDYRPVWIYGYADALHRLALWGRDNRRDAAEFEARLIVSTGEPISSTVEREIREILGVPVQNEYGCGEVGAMAYECSSGSLHLMSANVYVEILRPDGSRADVGEMGEVVVTDLTNYAQPLIRYRLADRSALLPMCDCELPWPILDRVEGRAMDVIVTPAGRRIYGALVTYHMRRISGDGEHFQQYQFVQVDRSTVEVRICSQNALPVAVMEEIDRFAREELNDMRVRITRVERIEREQSGKLRIVKNLLSSTASDLPLELPSGA